MDVQPPSTKVLCRCAHNEPISVAKKVLTSKVCILGGVRVAVAASLELHLKLSQILDKLLLFTLSCTERRTHSHKVKLISLMWSCDLHNGAGGGGVDVVLEEGGSCEVGVASCHADGDQSLSYSRIASVKML